MAAPRSNLAVAAATVAARRCACAASASHHPACILHATLHADMWPEIKVSVLPFSGAARLAPSSCITEHTLRIAVLRKASCMHKHAKGIKQISKKKARPG